MWDFEPPSWEGLSATHMILAAERGEIDALWQSGGNFKHTLPEPEMVARALGKIKLRIHQDIVVNPTMLVDPAETVVVLPSRTRYEQRGGGTETSTERRIIYSPEIPGPRIPETLDEWEIPVLVARAMNPGRANTSFAWQDTQDIRNEIDRVCPTYRGNRKTPKKRRQRAVWRAPPAGGSLLDSRRQGAFHRGGTAGRESTERPIPAVHPPRQAVQQHHRADVDPLTGAHRDDVLMATEDAARLGLQTGDAITLRNELGQFRGRVRVDRIKPGCLQAHWPEANVLIPAGRLDASGIPDYNATVDLVGGNSPGG